MKWSTLTILTLRRKEMGGPANLPFDGPMAHKRKRVIATTLAMLFLSCVTVGISWSWAIHDLKSSETALLQVTLRLMTATRMC